jgi:spore coat polysaccharide biosynthesis protein SpsF (cytidylyltransferase family)
VKPLAIVQARIGSTRLPGKMLLPLGGKPLVCWATQAAIDAFGVEHVKATVPVSAENDELAAVLEGMGVQVHRWEGDEADVLGRFHDVAHRHRWHPDSVIVRVTPDDPFKDPRMLRRVATGERLPVELGGEAFTLAQLDEAEAGWRIKEGDGMGGFYLRPDWARREHITHALFKTSAPSAPAGSWTVDTQEDYDRAKAEAGRRLTRVREEAGKRGGWLTEQQYWWCHHG